MEDSKGLTLPNVVHVHTPGPAEPTWWAWEDWSREGNARA